MSLALLLSKADYIPNVSLIDLINLRDDRKGSNDYA